MADAKATFALVGEDLTAEAFRSAIVNVETFAAKAQELIKGAFAIGGVTIAVDFVKSFAELGDNLVKGAERAGIAQTQFNQLAAAFAEADISAESLSKGIRNMQVALSKATNGNDAIAGAFNEIGLSATSLKQLAPDVELLAIAEALSKVEDPADRARIGAQLLGKQFLELEPVLLKGAAGLDALVKAAQGMDAQTAEDMARFNKELNEMGQFFKNWGAGTLDGVFKFGQGIKDTFSPDLATRISAIKTALASPDNFDASTVERMTKELAALQAQAAILAAPSANVTAAIAEQGKGNLEAVRGMMAEIDKNWTELTDKWAKQRSDQLDQEEKETQTRGEKRVEFEAKVDDLVLAHRITMMEALRRLYAADEAQSNAAADRIASTANQGAITAAWQATRKQWDENSAAMAADSKHLSDAMKEDFQKTQQLAKSTAQSIEDSFATFLMDPFDGGLKKMVIAWAQALEQMAAKAAAQEIFKSLFGEGDGLAGLLGSFFGGGGVAAMGSTADAGLAALAPLNATGGSYMVGGSGGTDSQLVRLRATPGEKVTVQTPGQQQAQGVTIHQTVNIDARTDSAQIGQLIKQSTQYAIQQSTATVANMVRRGAFTQ